jgi:G:T-mismatch repair DNA endonuclease (very short patch repair protein)
MVSGKTIYEMYGCWYHGCVKCGFAGKRRKQKSWDGIKNKALKRLGYKIVIVWEHEMYKELGLKKPY